MPATAIPKSFVLGSMSDMQRKWITSVGKNVRSGGVKSEKLFSQETRLESLDNWVWKMTFWKLAVGKRRGAYFNFFWRSQNFFRFNDEKRPLTKTEFNHLVAKLVNSEGVQQEELDLVEYLLLKMNLELKLV